MKTESLDQSQLNDSGYEVPKNLLCALTYLLGGISGFCGLHLKPYCNDREIRHHAWQSILFSGAWFIGSFVVNLMCDCFTYSVPVLGSDSGLNSVPSPVMPGGLFFSGMAHFAMSLSGILIWLKLIINAYNGGSFNLPFVSNLAARLAASWPKEEGV